MTKLLKIAGVTAGNQASGIKVDELGRIELSRTVEPKRIIGNVLEPYAGDYKGPVSVFGLELYAINSEIVTGLNINGSQPTPDGWLMMHAGSIFRYDSRGAIIWTAERRTGEGSRSRDGMPAVHGGHVYSVTQRGLGSPEGHTFAVDKISYKTGKIVQEGIDLVGAINRLDLVYAADIDRLVGVMNTGGGNFELIYIHPVTLAVEYSGTTLMSKLTSIFGGGAHSRVTVRYERGVIYVLSNHQGAASAKVDASINVTIQRLTKLFNNAVTAGAGVVLNGDVYSEGLGVTVGQIMRNGEVLYTRETAKKHSEFLGGTAGNLALMADGNKVLAFDKDNLVMSVEIPHDTVISNIAGDSMGNIFISATSGVYILGDTLQIKGYQLVG